MTETANNTDALIKPDMRAVLESDSKLNSLIFLQFFELRVECVPGRAKPLPK